MGFYALVSADFPGASVEKRKKIDECLKEKHWRKLPDVSTTYSTYFKDGVTKERATQVAIQHFQECAKPGSVTLVIQFGDDKAIEFP